MDSTQDQVSLNLQLSKELAIVKKELLFQNKEKSKRAAELVIANAQKIKRAAELVIADAEKAERAAELLIADMEKAQRTAELIILNAQALYDELTKLPNRRLFIDRFNSIVFKHCLSYCSISFFNL